MMGILAAKMPIYGARGGARTPDRTSISRLLYQLSYTRIMRIYHIPTHLPNKLDKVNFCPIMPEEL